MKPRDFYERYGIKTADFIKAMQTTFPKYSPAANSLCNNSELSGVTLSPAAVNVLKLGKRSNRSKPFRFNFRLLQSDYDEFEAVRAANDMTVQAACEAAVKLFIEANKKTASAGTENGQNKNT